MDRINFLSSKAAVYAALKAGSFKEEGKTFLTPLELRFIKNKVENLKKRRKERIKNENNNIIR
jgi:hypothetical protein